MEITRNYFIIPGPLLTHLTLSMWKLFFPLRVVPFFFFLFTTPDDHSHHLSICCIEIYLYKKKAGGELLVFETAVEQSYQSTSWRDLIIEKNILSPVGRPSDIVDIRNAPTTYFQLSLAVRRITLLFFLSSYFFFLLCVQNRSASVCQWRRSLQVTRDQNSIL